MKKISPTEQARGEALTQEITNKLVALVNEFKTVNPDVPDEALLCGLSATLAIGIVMHVDGDPAGIESCIDFAGEYLRVYAHAQAESHFADKEAGHARPH